jgi:hypothetical protein
MLSICPWGRLHGDQVIDPGLIVIPSEEGSTKQQKNRP